MLYTWCHIQYEEFGKDRDFNKHLSFLTFCSKFLVLKVMKTQTPKGSSYAREGWLNVPGDQIYKLCLQPTHSNGLENKPCWDQAVYAWQHAPGPWFSQTPRLHVWDHGPNCSQDQLTSLGWHPFPTQLWKELSSESICKKLCPGKGTNLLNDGPSLLLSSHIPPSSA